MDRPRSPMTDSERSGLSHGYQMSTSTRAIYILERKAFGREPITNAAPMMRCAGSPRSPSPSSSGAHLERVRMTLPALANVTDADFFQPPKPPSTLQRLVPKLSDFFDGPPCPLPATPFILATRLLLLLTVL